MPEVTAKTRTPSAHMERKKEQIRQTLQSNGVRLVAEHGLDKVSVEQILEAAGYSRRTFYGYFANKLELLASAINPVLEEGTKLLEKVSEQEPEHLLAGIVDCYLKLWESHSDVLIAISSLDSTTIGPYIESSHRQFGGEVMKVLGRVADAGMLRNKDAAYSFRIITRTAIPLLKLYAPHPDGERLYRESMLALLGTTGTLNQ